MDFKSQKLYPIGCEMGKLLSVGIYFIVSMNQQHKEVTSKLIKITMLSFVFMGVELVGGYLAHSIAIWADAFHLLSDVLAYIISLVAVWLSIRKSPFYLSFGWEKAQPLGALFNIVFIYIVTIQLFIEATHRMIKKDAVQEPVYMLITSIFGLVCNIIILGILHNDPNGGHSGCSHGHHKHEAIESDHHGHDHHSHDHHGHDHHDHDHHDHSHGDSCTGRHLGQISKSEVTCHSQEHKCNGHGHSAQHKHTGPMQVQIGHIHSSKCSHNPHEQVIHDHICQEGEKNSGDELGCTPKKETNPNQVSIEDGLLSHVESDDEIKDHHHGQNKIKNLNLEAAYIHIVTDIILSIGVIISALIIYFMAGDKPEWSPWHLADPLCTYLFSFLAVYSTWPILKQSLLFLLDACQSPEMVKKVEREVKSLPEVKELMQMKLWSNSRGKHYAALRVKLAKGAGSWRVRQVFKKLKVTSFVQVEEQLLLAQHL